MNTTKADEWFTLREAAVYTGRHPQVLKYHYYRSGLLHGRKKGHTLLFTQTELDDYLKAVAERLENRRSPSIKLAET